LQTAAILKIKKNRDTPKPFDCISMKFGLLIYLVFWTLWARKNQYLKIQNGRKPSFWKWKSSLIFLIFWN